MLASMSTMSTMSTHSSPIREIEDQEDGTPKLLTFFDRMRKKEKTDNTSVLAKKTIK